MERLGKFAEARAKVLADVKRLVATVQRVAATPFSSVEGGIAVLKELRTETSEDLNQIQHEFMIVCAAIMFLMMRGHGTRRGSAAEILKERYARGEIGDEEYEKRRRVLDS